MSSNNQLILRKHKSRWWIYHNHCVDNDFEFEENKPIIILSSKKKAIEWVNDYCMKNLVEYGFTIVEPIEIEKAKK